jgi:low temperature requirement protein LtrA
MELFFDLVYVLAITQLTGLLRAHLTGWGVLHTALLLLAVWWAWTDTAWVTNWFDPDQRGVRLVLIGIMLLSLIMSGAVGGAYGRQGLWFAGAYAAIQIGRTGFAAARLRTQPRLRRNFERILVWKVAAGALWVAGGFLHDGARTAGWAVAVVLEYVAAAVGFAVPGWGRSSPADWPISGEHLAARYQQFVLIALGESILVTGATFGALAAHPAVLAAFVSAFLGSVALWWVYFDRAAVAASGVIAASTDPGRLARSAYTYYQLPIIAGVILSAVGDEITIHAPSGHPDWATIGTVLGGPALFLTGHALFKRAVFGRLSGVRLAAVGVLAGLAALGPVVPPVALSALAALVVVAVAVSDRWEALPHGR